MKETDLKSNGTNAFWGDLDDDAVLVQHEDVLDFNAENILKQPDQTLNHIRGWLNPTHYDGDGSELEKHRAAHLPGTGTWVYHSQAYQQWYDSDEHGILWIRGIPGSGKSVLASTLVHDLTLEHVPTVYFFLRNTIEANHEPEAMLRDWLAQILIYSPPLQLEFKGYSERTYDRVSVESLPMEHLCRWLRKAVTYLPRVYCVVDALDEMNRESLEPFLRALDALGQWRPGSVKLVITSRPVAIVEQKLKNFKVLDVRLDKKHVEDDLDLYVQSRLGSSHFPLWLRQGAKDELLKKADGLFLYAKLALDTLLQAETDDQMCSLLEDLPTDLTVMYANLLADHSRQWGIQGGLQELVLQLVTHATRPLRLLEIAGLLSFVRNDNANLGEIKDLVRLVCGPLLEILPDETVRVVHHSLTEYLKGAGSTSHPRPFPVFQPGPVNAQIAVHCLRYLATGNLEQVKFKSRRKVSGDVNYVEPALLTQNQILPPFCSYAGVNWPTHVRRAIAAGHSQHEINDVLDMVMAEVDLDKLDVLANTKMTGEPSPLRFAIALDLREYAQRTLARARPEDLRGTQTDKRILFYAIEKANPFMVKSLIDHGASLTERDVYGHTLLHKSVKAGYLEITSLLLDAGLDPLLQSGPDLYHGMPGEGELPWRCLDRAMSKGSLDMVSLFVKYLRTDDQVNEAFDEAVSAENHAVIRHLLKDNRVDVDDKVNDSTPLYKACMRRDLHTITLLLENGADPNILHIMPPSPDYGIKLHDPFEDYYENPSGVAEANASAMGQVGENALHALATGIYHPSRKVDDRTLVQCFKILVQYGTQVDQVDAKGDTPLHRTTSVAAVQCLLEAGASVDAVNFDGETLLHNTFSDEIISALIPIAQLELKTLATHRTPLLHALVDSFKTFTSEAQRYKKAVKLLEAGADATAVDCNGNSILHLALVLRDVEKEGLPLVRRVCKIIELVNLRNKRGKTALHMNAPGSGCKSHLGWPAGRFNPEIYDLLIAAGADHELKNEEGETPLFQLVQHSDSHKLKEDIERMLAKGARTDILDSRGRTLLHAAVSRRPIDEATIDFLIGHGVSPTSQDYDGNTLIHDFAPLLAKSNEKEEVLQKLIHSGVNPCQPNHCGVTPLHILSRFRPAAFDPCLSTSAGGRPTNADNGTIYNRFVQLYDCVDVADDKGVTPLHYASSFSEYLTTQLLAVGSDPSRATNEGLNALHIAARSRQGNILGILLDHIRSYVKHTQLMCTLNARDTLNRSPLYYAAASGHIASVQLLLDAGASVDCENYDGSPWNGCVDFEAELKSGDWARQVTTDTWATSFKSGSSQAAAGGVEIADTRRPEKVICNRQLGKTAFDSARLDEVVELLVQTCGVSATGIIDLAIRSAIAHGRLYTAKTLMDGRLALPIKIPADLTENVHRSTEIWPDDVAASSDQGKSLIDLTKSRHHEVVRRRLQQYTASKSSSLHEISDVVHQLVSEGFVSLASAAITKEIISNNEWREERDHRGMERHSVSHVRPLLITACRRQEPNMDMVKMLVEVKKVEVNARLAGSFSRNEVFPNGASALHVLAGSSHWWNCKAIEYLVEHGADLEMKDEEHLTPLGVALRAINGPHFSHRVVQLLLTLGANPNAEGRSGRSCLSMTIGHKDVFRPLVQHGATITQPTMVAAIRTGNVELLETMLKNGADPNMRKLGYEEPSRKIDENSFTTGRHDPNDDNEKYLLDLIASDTNEKGLIKDAKVQMLKVLLTYGANPFGRYKRTTVLHRVIQNQRSTNTFSEGLNPYLDILLETQGLDLETRDAEGLTILLLAASGGYGVGDEQRLHRIESLVARGADVRAKDNKSRNLLHHLSSTRGYGPPKSPSNKDIEYVIAAASELINGADDGGRTPLHHCLTERPDAASILIAMGADVHSEDHRLNRPLHTILRKGQWTVTGRQTIGENLWLNVYVQLIKRGADLNARNADGETPLFEHFRTAVVTGEIEMPPPTDSENEESQGPRQRSSKRHWKQRRLEGTAGVEKEHIVLDQFERDGADWSILNNAGQSLLHVIAQDTTDEKRYACEGRRVKRFQSLLGKGLDVSLEDHEHRTALDLAAELVQKDLLNIFKRDE